MSNWEKIITSGSHAELKSIFISGMDVIPTSGFHQTDFASDGTSNNFWDPGNSGWVNGIDNSQKFTAMPSGGSTPTLNTGPMDGPNSLVDQDLTKAQSSGNPYMYIEATGFLATDFKLRSPIINLTNHTNNRLIMYVHSYTPSTVALPPGIRFRYGASTDNILPAEAIPWRGYKILGDEWSNWNSGMVYSYWNFNNSDAFVRIEVDLDVIPDGDHYVYAEFKTDSGSDAGDLAIANMYLSADTVPDLEVTHANDINFRNSSNIPTTDPLVPGRMYRNPNGYLKVSQG